MRAGYDKGVFEFDEELNEDEKKAKDIEESIEDTLSSGIDILNLACTSEYEVIKNDVESIFGILL